MPDPLACSALIMAPSMFESDSMWRSASAPSVNG
jgi:hypothetical protein